MANAYQLIVTPPGSLMQTVRRVSDGALIPFDDGNLDYQEYLAWIAAGNTADDPEPGPKLD